MSKIGSDSNIINQQLNIVITTSTFDELETYMSKEYSVGISGALLLSIPTDKNGEDKINNASIWVTDSSGLLFPVSYPISKINEMENTIKNFNEYLLNIEIAKIELIKTTTMEWIHESENDYSFEYNNQNEKTLENILSENFKIKIIYKSGYIVTNDFNLYTIEKQSQNNEYITYVPDTTLPEGNYRIRGVLKHNDNSFNTTNYIYITIVR